MQPGLTPSLAHNWAEVSLEDEWLTLTLQWREALAKVHAITWSSEHLPLLMAEKTCISPWP